MKRLLITVILILGIVAFSNVQIVLYTSVPSSIIAEIEKAFEKAYPDIDLVVWRSGTSKVTAKIMAELKAGEIKADVIWTADPSYFLYLKEKGLLEKYVSSEFKYIPETFKDPEGYFVGTRIMAVTIAYNTDLLKKSDLPKSWEDLLEKKFKDSVISASPLYSGTNLVWLYAMEKLYGWNFMEKLYDNGLTVVSSNKTVSQELAKGAYKVAVVLDYMIRDLKSKGSHVDLLYLDKNNVLIWSPIAIIKGSNHIEEARKFVDFVISKEGQNILVKMGKLISVRTDVEMPEGTPKLEELISKSLKIDWEDLKNVTDELKDEFSDIFE
ncbi:MAG: ABC transporter substrate-binding protein [Thermotogaceae bacterium]|nr:ABC transporter substrate-binding protein [Thermotogaceae bacterium]